MIRYSQYRLPLSATLVTLLLLNAGCKPTAVPPAAEPGVSETVAEKTVTPITESISLAPITVSNTTVAWNGSTGLTVAWNGIPVVTGSVLRLAESGESSAALLDTADTHAAMSVVTPWKTMPSGGKRAEVTLDNNAATCRYTIAIARDGSVTIDLAYKVKPGTPPALLDYAAALFPGELIQDAPSHAVGSNGPVAMRTLTATQPNASDADSAVLASAFKRLVVQTPKGKLNVIYSGGAASQLVDARASRNLPGVRLGLGAPTLSVKSADGEGRATFTLALRDIPGSGPSAPPKAIADSGLPAPLIIPRPKHVSRTGTVPFALTKNTRLIIPDHLGEGEWRAVEALRREIRERFGFDLPPTSVLEAHNSSENAILFGGATVNPLIEQLRQTGIVPPTPNKPEGYVVAVTPHVAVVSGKDAPGMLWGAQTMCQLLDGGNNGNAVIKSTVVEDWPSLPMRAIHLFHGKNALPFHQKLMDRIFTRYKINALFIESEQVRWNHDPTVAPEWAGSPAQLRAEVAYARDRGITVYPLFQSYGHMGWLLENRKNRPFAEDPEIPYALNFTNPQAVSYLDGFVKEADDLFQAPAFHVGLDEVTQHGRFPYASKGTTMPQLYARGATHWRDFFRARNKPVFMWADMAMHVSEVAPSFGTARSPEEAAQVRALLPKDIIMVDWQYGEFDHFPSLKKLKDAGFTKLIAATWYRPKNIRNFTRAATQIGAIGAIQTTWAGYESNESILDKKERNQFTAMVMAADYFWNGGEGPMPDALPYDPAAVFKARWEGKPEPPPRKPVHLGL